MPHRIVGQYVYAFLASGTVALSFLASVGESVAEPARNAMYAVGDVPAESLSPVAMSWLGFFGALAVVAGKTWSDLRARNREADIADYRAWGDELVTARKELGDARSQLETANERLNTANDRLNAATRRAADLDAKNQAMAASMTVMQAKLAQLTSSQNDVITVVNKQQTKVKDAVKRVGELEQAVSSSSNLEFPAPPPAEDSTAIDLPTMG